MVASEYLVEPLNVVIDKNPFKNYEEAAKAFENNTAKYLHVLDNQSTNCFLTSDFALYWCDYQSGYDVVQLASWDETILPLKILLVRGAANLQDKSWGQL